ncbi:hypothetical protein ACVFYP_08050 [Roseomonas sp. F4]
MTPVRRPRTQRRMPGSLGLVDRLARMLGWFSLGLGVAQIVAPRRMSRALGLPGQAHLMRGYGAREVASGVMSLSVDRGAGLRSRVIGDAIDAATLLTALRPGNPARGRAVLALGFVAGVTALDLFTSRALTKRHGRGQPVSGGVTIRGRDLSGFPQGVAKARGAAAPKRVAAS